MEEKSNSSRRRRSSFFQRRLSLFKDASETSFNEDNKCSEEDEESKITRYINKLKNEKCDWKRLLERLKKEHSELQHKSPTVIDCNSSWEQLMPDDRQFLQEQVDYVSLGRLLDSTVAAVMMRHRLTTSTINQLLTLAYDCHQNNLDIIDAIIDRSYYHFDEFDLWSEDSD